MLYNTYRDIKNNTKDAGNILGILTLQSLGVLCDENEEMSTLLRLD